MNPKLKLRLLGTHTDSWLESLQQLPKRSPHSGKGCFAFIASNLAGDVNVFTPYGERRQLMRAQAPSGIGLDERGRLVSLVEVLEEGVVRRWDAGVEIDPVSLDGIRYPNDMRYDQRTDTSWGGAIGAALSKLSEHGDSIIVPQPFYGVRHDSGEVFKTAEEFVCLNGIAVEEDMICAVESYGSKRLLRFNLKGREVVSIDQIMRFPEGYNPDGVALFQVGSEQYLAVCCPFANSVGIVSLDQRRIIFEVESEVGMPVTPVVEVAPSGIRLTSVVTLPGPQTLFVGSKSGLAVTNLPLACFD